MSSKTLFNPIQGVTKENNNEGEQNIFSEGISVFTYKVFSISKVEYTSDSGR